MALVEVHRLLHTNYNCSDVDVVERWYRELFALKAVMRSESEGIDGTYFGLQMENSHRTCFLYDHRGPRRTSSLEIVQWLVPPTLGRPYPNPWDHGIQSVAFTAPDLDEIERLVGSVGGSVVRRSDEWMLLKDPEDLNVEVYRAPGTEPEQIFLRVVAHDLAQSLDWWGRLGYTRADSMVRVPGDEVWVGSGERRITDEVGLVGTDDPGLGVLFTTWSGPPPVGPTYGAPFHQGLYRFAMAVDDARAAWEVLREHDMAIPPPYTFPMPGTKITDGLTILFLRDPDGILVELVERPRSFFAPPEA